MPSLDLKQITDKLNAEFTGDTRKIVFWYDDAAEFAEDIDALGIVGAKLHKLTPANQFSTKYLLERQDTESSYLIYAPFPKPDVRDNALEDTLLYSHRFYADRASLLAVDLRIDEKHKPVIQKYIKFFAKKNRTQRFYDFEIENFTSETIETALMSALCKARTASFEEVLRVVLTDGGFEDNPFFEEFDKYGLLPAFWQICEDSLGYTDNTPSLVRLAATLFATYTARQLRGDVPQAWKGFVSYKSGSIIAFLDSLMNSLVYQERYDELARHIAAVLNAREFFGNTEIEQLLDCDAFHVFDEYIIGWIAGRLLDEDTGASVTGLDIPGICKLRKAKHFGAQYAPQYMMISSAYEIIRQAGYFCPERFGDILKQYIVSDYRIDSHYRNFYVSYDRLPDAESFDNLRVLIENIYTNKYLSKLLPSFNSSLDVKSVMREEHAQLRFFEKRIKYAKEKTVVIISDALRYEVGRELFDKLNSDPNCDAEIKYMIGVLPAYTQLGMAALLPHKSLDLAADGKVIIDDRSSDDIEKREAVLQAALPDSRCVRFDRLPVKKNELREIFTGMDAVYIYHDHIDNRGSSSEDEVFAACSEAIDEIFTLIKRLAGSANVYRFIITSDHGFLYKRERFTESEKIGLDGLKGVYANRRFIIADNAVVADGVASSALSDIIGGSGERIVSWPSGVTVFKTHGGLNYVHGGASPQEMILPLITVKTEKGHVDTHPAKIALVSMVRKITNLITQLDFIQQEPVSDVVTSAEYKMYFISDENEKISNEQLYQADRKDVDPNKRVFCFRFNFKNKKYDGEKQYWLVAVDNKSGVELFRHQVIMDIAFADDFGFDI